MDEFDRLGFNQLPPSGKTALDQMKALIDDSAGPADVGVAVSLGLGYLLAVSNEPEDILKVTIMTAMKVKQIMEAGIEKDRSDAQWSN
jgi:hypothetical protein